VVGGGWHGAGRTLQSGVEEKGKRKGRLEKETAGVNGTLGGLDDAGYRGNRAVYWDLGQREDKLHEKVKRKGGRVKGASVKPLKSYAAVGKKHKRRSEGILESNQTQPKWGSHTLGVPQKKGVG